MRFWSYGYDYYEICTRRLNYLTPIGKFPNLGNDRCSVHDDDSTNTYQINITVAIQISKKRDKYNQDVVDHALSEASLNRFPDDWRRVRNSPRTKLTTANRRQDEDDAAAVRLTDLQIRFHSSCAS